MRPAWVAVAFLTASPVFAAEVAQAPAPPPEPAPAAAAPAAPPTPATTTADGELDPDTLILFSLDLDRMTLSDSLSGYGDPADPLLPLGEIVRVLELDVDVQPAERRIVGRIGETRRSLAADLSTGQVRNGAQTFTLPAGAFALTPTEVYVRASAIARLLPVKIAVDTELLAVTLQATETLPIQGRLERVARLRDAGSRVDARDEVLEIASPYRFLTLPAFDVSVGAGAEVSGDQRFPVRYDLRAAGDLLWTGYQAYLGSDETGQPSTARLLFERRSLEGRLLGPLKARVISVGDVFTPGLSVGPRSVSGAGLALSTVPLDQTNVFNRVDLRGELPIGYDVELYVNDILRSGQATPTQGRYEFLNVPLSRGVNVIRIVTYGPRGERTEQTKIVNVGGGQLARGETTFEFGAVQQETPLIQVRERTADDLVTQGVGGLRLVAQANYGLTQYLTISAGAALYPPNADTERQVYALGARTSIFGVLTQFDLAIDDNGGQAASLGLAATFLGSSVVGRHAEFRGGFFDENGPAAELTRPIVTRSELTLDASAPIFERIVPFTLRGLRTVYADGAVDLTGSARASTTLSSVLVSGGLEYQGLRSPVSGATDRVTGYLSASTFRDFKWQLRGALDFDAYPDPQFRSLAITADRDLSENLSLRLGLSQSLQSFDETSVSASGIVRLPYLDLAFTGDYNTRDSSWRAGVQASFGLAFNRDAGRYVMTRAGPGAGGIVLFHAFVDANANGRWDEGEAPVPDVLVEGGERRTTTGADGKVLVTGVGGGPTSRLNVGLDQVDATFLKAPPAAIQIQPRPGGYTEVIYAMRPTGEVLVKILLKRPDGRRVGLSAVRLQVIDPEGKVAAEASTEFDGTVIFQDLPIGSYRIELEPEQAKRLRMRLNEPLATTIKPDGQITPDLQAEVSFEAREPAAGEDPAPAESQ